MSRIQLARRWTDMVMKYVNWALRRQGDDSDTPRCPDHKVDMRLRGIIGQPARYHWQSEEAYTYIFFCPVDKCNQTVEVLRRKSQVPGGTDVPKRPVFARPNDQ